MIRKALIAAAGVLALGTWAAPASAQSFSVHVGSPGWGDHHYGRDHYREYPRYHYREYPRYRDTYIGIHPRRHCERVVIKKRIPGGWKKIVRRNCERVYW